MHGLPDEILTESVAGIGAESFSDGPVRATGAQAGVVFGIKARLKIIVI